jgi:hypothetical protein
MVGKCIGAKGVQISHETFPSTKEGIIIIIIIIIIIKEKKRRNHRTKQTMHPPNKQMI